MTASPQHVPSPSAHSHSALPSPPISPISPSPTSPYSRTATTARIRLGKPTPSPSQSQDRHQARMKRASASPLPSLSNIGVGVGVGADVEVRLPDGDAVPIASPSANTPTQASGDVKAKRRQSSIAYFTPSSPSPWDTKSMGQGESSVGKRESVTSGGGSKRTSMVMGMGARVGSGRESICEVDGSKEREPLTLVEKHADLLHFIAQKERKCLELRDQLAIHEKELAELKRKWERIVNRGFTPANDVHSHPTPNPLLNSSLGGVALDGLKEGVRMLASGLNEVIQDLEPTDKEKKNVPATISSITTTSNPKPGHTQHESDSSTSVSLSTGTGSISHFSTSSRSSIWEGPSGDAVASAGDKEMVATAPSLSRAGSLNSRMHKRASASRTQSKERTSPPSAFVSGLSQRATNVEFGEFISSPAASVSVSASSSKPSSKSTASAHTPITPPDPSSWMDSMGKKLEELQKGQVFSKSQKRASVLLAGVSNSIASALLPVPTATTPAPSSLASPRLSSTTTIPSKGMENWLDEEEEQTKHAGDVMVPVLVSRTGTKTKTSKACKPNAVSSFDDDDWNW